MKTREVSTNDSLRADDHTILVRNTDHPVAISVDPATLPILQNYFVENLSIGPVFVYPGRHIIRPGYRVRVFTADGLSLKVAGSRLN